ncbi:MAG: sulfatase [Verrucomicrobiota bacterium]
MSPFSKKSQKVENVDYIKSYAVNAMALNRLKTCIQTLTKVLTIFVGVSIVANASAKANDSKPNIILMYADDLGWMDLGCQGSDYYETPHLDKLAADGIRFTNAYAAASNCAPSRASLMTGQYPARHGVYTVDTSLRGASKDRRLIPTPNTEFIKDEHLTLAEVLKDNGYTTGHFGKWHITKDPTQDGFDLNIGGNSAGGPYTGGYHSPYRYPNCSSNEPGEYLTDRMGSEAIKFIEENKETPFFIYFSTYSVHGPWQAKKEYVEKFKAKQPSKAHNDPVYAGMLQSLDENIGRLLAKIDELDLSDNTLIVFTSDNGGVYRRTKQWPLRAGKGSYFEGGIREPFIARWIGKIEPGKICDVPVSQIDLFPTFLEAVGIEVPKGKLLDGVSIMPLLTQSGDIDNRALFWHFPIYLQKGNGETRDRSFRARPGSAVRYGDWKLHEDFETGNLELYNLKDDISEKNDLSEKMPEQVAELHTKLKSWRSQLDAPVPTELNPEYKP